MVFCFFQLLTIHCYVYLFWCSIVSFGHWKFLLADFYTLRTFFFSAFMFSGITRCSMVMLYFISIFQPWNETFFQGAPEWYLEANIWAQKVLIAVGESLFPGHLLNRTRQYTYVYTWYIHNYIYIYFHIYHIYIETMSSYLQF